MAAEIGLLSMTQIQKLSQSHHQHQHHHHRHHYHQDQPNPSSPTGSWMWNPREQQEDDDSWEVRAFAEDTRNIMGTTWPPRSYTCTFCRREFRSAQALGGHMNVHRRDRARLHQAQPATSLNHNSSPTSSFIIPSQELCGSGGLCLFYHLPSPNGTFPAAAFTTLNNACEELVPPSTLLSISPYPPNSLISTSLDFPAPSPGGINTSSYCNSAKLEEAATSSSSANNGQEEVDLELRLGHRPAPT